MQIIKEIPNSWHLQDLARLSCYLNGSLDICDIAHCSVFTSNFLTVLCFLFKCYTNEQCLVRLGTSHIGSQVALTADSSYLLT